MNQNLSQSHPREENPRKMSNPYSKNTQNNNSPNNLPNSSKYSSSRPYHPQRDYRNNNIRERSRSREINQRQSFHEHQYNNFRQTNQNNYESNYQRNKPYFRQNISEYNNQRQFETKYNKDKYNNLQNSQRANNNYYPKELSKDDCLILLPKNYYNYIKNDFDKLKNRLKNELKDDIYNILYSYSIQNFNENIFKFTAYSFQSISTAIKIIADFLFEELKKMYDKSTYLKLSFS